MDSRTFVKGYYGIAYYNDTQYCVGTNILEVTDQANPTIFTDWSAFPKDAIVIDSELPMRGQRTQRCLPYLPASLPMQTN